MARINQNGFERLTAYSPEITYKLKTSLIEPPELTLRLKPLDRIGLLDAAGWGAEMKLGKIIAAAALEAVIGWDLQNEASEPIPLTEENKQRYLLPLLSAEIADGRPGELLGIKIFTDATDPDLFIKKN